MSSWIGVDLDGTLARRDPWELSGMEDIAGGLLRGAVETRVFHLRGGVKLRREITLFPDYNQGENRTTNYCLVMLRLLYDHDPRLLAAVIGNLVDEDAAGAIGLEFEQQRRAEGCVPDGVLRQAPFTLYIETKEGERFDGDQLRNHLVSLAQEPVGVRVLLALGRFDGTDNRSDRLPEVTKEASEYKIAFAAVSFEEFLSAIAPTSLPPPLRETWAEFGQYLDRRNLLPTWKRRLDVVNCARTYQAVIEKHAYVCGAASRQNTHRRSRYFGVYAGDQTVTHVAEILGVIDIDTENRATELFLNAGMDPEALKERARHVPHATSPRRVFLLGQLYETDFRKDTSGGLFGNKTYFDVKGLGGANAEELADRLRGKKWSEVPGDV